jgi:hypothetical protein
MLLAAYAGAQTVERSALEACAALPTDTERLECFQALAGADRPADDPSGSPPEVEQAAVTPDSVPEAPAPSAAPAAAPVAAPLPTDPVAEPEPAAEAATVSPEPDAVAEARSSGPSTATPAEPAPMDEAVQAERSDDDFGREHVEPRQQPDAYELRAVVTNAERKRDKGVTFYLDNGQVWQQVDDRYFPYPKGGDFEIVIAEGMMGDYRLRVGGEGRMIRVRRTK